MPAINLRLTDEQHAKMQKAVELLNKTAPPGATYSLNSWIAATMENEADKVLTRK